MKYIRTKEGIFEVIYVSPLGFVRIDKRNGTYPIVFENEIIKQADTIEELLDEIVVVDEARFKNPRTLRELNKDLDEAIEMYGYKYLFGAIWTDKGLIYVAKMNDKGELELL